MIRILHGRICEHCCRVNFTKEPIAGIPYCPAYLTESEWNNLQEIQNANVKRAPSGRIYLFSGMINCPICGRRLSARGGSSIINRKTGAKKYTAITDATKLLLIINVLTDIWLVRIL